MGKAAPKAPDPVATANAQAAANTDAARVTARINRGDSFGPGGSVVNAETSPDHWVQTTTLSPGQQGIYNNQETLGNITSKSASDAAWRMSQQLGTSIDTKGLPQFGGPVDASRLPFRDDIGTNAKFMTYGAGAGQGLRTDVQDGKPLDRLGTPDFSADRTKVEQALLSRTEPAAARDRADMEARLAAQGFTPGSQGYKDGADELNRARNDARMQAVIAGGVEQSRLFGMDVGRTGFNNQASEAETAAHNAGVTISNQAQQQGYQQRAGDAGIANSALDSAFQQQAQGAAFTNMSRGQALNEGYAASDFQTRSRQQLLAEQLQLRAQPINEVSALFGLGNGINVPSPANLAPVNVAAPDYQGLVQNQYNTKSQAASAGNSAVAQGLSSAASAAAIAF